MSNTFHRLALIVVVVFSVLSCSNDNDLSPNTPNPEEHQSVDLGLSVLWATQNIGAKGAADLGKSFAWGDPISEKSNLKPNVNVDVANVLWGGDWRLPTKSEIEELYANCKWSVEKENEKIALRVTGPNNNSIAFPTQSLGLSGDVECAGTTFWSSTHVSSSATYVFGYVAGFPYYNPSTSIDVTYSLWGLFKDNFSIQENKSTAQMRPVRPNPNYSGGNNNNGNDNNGGNNNNGGDNNGGNNNGGNNNGGSVTYEKPRVDFYDFTSFSTAIVVEFKIFNNDKAQVSSAQIYYGKSRSTVNTKVQTYLQGTTIWADANGLEPGTEYFLNAQQQDLEEQLLPML